MNDVATTLPLQVFTQRNFAADFFRQNVNFAGTGKTAKSHSVPPFGGLRIAYYTVHMVRWKACGRLPVSTNWTFFTSCHGWGTMSGYWSQSLCSKGGWVTLTANFRRNGASPTNDSWLQKTRVPGLSRGVVYVVVRLAVLTQYWRVTDKHADRQTDGRTDTRRRLIPALASVTRVKIIMNKIDYIAYKRIILRFEKWTNTGREDECRRKPLVRPACSSRYIDRYLRLPPRRSWSQSRCHDLAQSSWSDCSKTCRLRATIPPAASVYASNASPWITSAGRVIGPLCMCLFVCLSVWTITFEINDLWPKYFTTRSKSTVKVIGQSSPESSGSSSSCSFVNKLWQSQSNHHILSLSSSLKGWR